MKASLFVPALLLVCLLGPSHAAPGEAAQARSAAAATPSATEILFEQPQMRNTAAGSTIRYTYSRRSGIAKGPFGPPLDDEIRLSIEPGKDADSRDIQVQMFSGANRAPAGPFENMPGNPILPLFLENHLKGIAGLLDANPRYIKNAIRKSLRDNATVTATKTDYKGQQVDAWRIVTKPFAGDAHTDKLRGFDALTFTFVTSSAVPGEIVSIEANARKPDGGELLEEKLSYDQSAR